MGGGSPFGKPRIGIVPAGSVERPLRERVLDMVPYALWVVTVLAIVVRWTILLG